MNKKIDWFLFKSFIFVFMIVCVFFFLRRCHKLSVNIPQYYDRCEEYFENGIMDSADYCKYYYNENTVKAFFDDVHFKETDEESLKELNEITEIFEGTAEFHNHLSAYDFDRETQLKNGDLYCVVTKSGVNKGKWDEERYVYYDLYYVDMEKNILYYFHLDT